MKPLFALACAVCVPMLGEAQAPHVCDVPTTAVTIARNRPVTLLFCARPEEWVVGEIQIDDPTPDTVIEFVKAQPMTVESADGYVQYAVPLGRLSPGTHTLTITVTYRDAAGVEHTSDLSSPYTFTVDAKPGRPKVTGVQ